MKNLTCIVGLVDKGNVYIGGDSAAIAGTSICIRKDTKVFSKGPFIMGFTSSFRMGQILRYKLEIPRKDTDDDMEYMSTSFIDNVRHCFSKNGYSFDDEDDSFGGAFLVGYNKCLYVVDIDYHVGIPSTPYYSVGCGADIALGAMYATTNKKPIDRIKIALQAASEFSSGVAPPFNIVKQIYRK